MNFELENRLGSVQKLTTGVKTPQNERAISFFFGQNSSNWAQLFPRIYSQKFLIWVPFPYFSPENYPLQAMAHNVKKQFI